MWSKCIFLLVLVKYGFCLKILAIFSGPFGSHYAAFKPLLYEFANRGHSVTILNNYPDNKPLPNMRFVDLKIEHFKNIPIAETDSVKFPRLNYYIVDWWATQWVTNTTCEALLTDRDVKAHLAEGVKYDVVFVEQFVSSECELAYAGTLFDAPIIGITSHVMLPETYPRLGIPFNVAADAFYHSIGGQNPSLLYKLEALFGNIYFNVIKKWVVQSIMYESFHRYLPHLSFDLEKVVREKMKMVFVYQHHSVTGARVLSPRVIEIGGLHVPKPKPLPTDIEHFLSTAQHGAVYVSFGSNLNASTMSPEKLQQFLVAFKSVPQKILWKWESDNFPAGHENILAKKWFPQVDVLCHPKVMAFVSHGGMLSLSESAHCGKPMLAVPFFGDQFTNAASLKTSGLGTYVYFQDITSEILSETIKKLTSAEVQQTAQRVSQRWHDRPQSALDSAVYWTEYVARHRDAPPALPSTRSAWFETALLDVYTVLIAIVLLLYWICYLIYKLVRLIICRVICRRLCKRKVKKQ